MLLLTLKDMILTLAAILAPYAQQVDTPPTPPAPPSAQQDVIQLVPLPLIDPLADNNRGSFDGILWDNPRALDHVSRIA